MPWKAQQFPPSTRPHLQSPLRPPGSADKCLMRATNHALTRPHLQSRLEGVAHCACAAAYGYVRCTAGALAGIAASNQGELHATRVGPAHRYRDSRHRSGASPAASVAGVPAGRPLLRSSIAGELGGAAQIRGRRLRIAGSACSTLSVLQLHGSMHSQAQPITTKSRSTLDQNSRSRSIGIRTISGNHDRGAHQPRTRCEAQAVRSVGQFA